jgi:hypothetical protein
MRNASTLENYGSYHFIQTNDLLNQNLSYSSAEIFSGDPLEFELDESRLERNLKKKSPVLELAKPEDAAKIVNIYEEIYDGTYPYKEMEDPNVVQTLIEDPSIRWILFLDPSTDEIAGCVTLVHDLFNKRGYVRGFMVREKFRGKLDTVKAMLGSMLGTYDDFKGKAFSWYVENRTAHTSSQYPMYRCGLHPIGFYPNKDVFFNAIESDLMQIAYDERAFTEWKPTEVPQIIPEVHSCYEYSARNYPLREVSYQSPPIKLRKSEIIRWKSRIKRAFSTDPFGYHYITLYYLESNAYFKFLYTPRVQNFEKTEYEVENNEQLSVFLQDFATLKKLLNVRYCEAFVSAYNPEHQSIFKRAGLEPRGYVPRWKFNDKTNKLEDQILFNWYAGSISKDIKLIDAGKTLLRYLNVRV